MPNFEASDIDTFKAELSKLKITVPARGEGRKTEHCEQYQIYHLLKALFCSEYFALPVSLKKRERPDFELKLGEITWGIETTEVVHPDWAKASTLPESKHESTVLDPSLFKWGTKSRNLKKLKEDASKDKLTGPGWAGESVETEFSQSILDTVRSKHEKLVGGYKRYDTNCLLVYHNLSSPILDFERSAFLTNEALKDYWQLDGFNLVIVHKHDSIAIYSIKGIEWLVRSDD